MITSRATSARTPCFTSAASPSPAAHRFTASRALFTAFTACPAPTGPTCTIFPAKASIASRACSRARASPPTITVKVPRSAPVVPPETGASRKATPRSASRAAMARLASGSPEVQSTQTVPALR